MLSSDSATPSLWSYHSLIGAGAPLGGVADGRTLDALQAVVNDTAERSLTVRKALRVEYTEGGVPLGALTCSPSPHAVAELGVAQSFAVGFKAATLLAVEFGLDAASLQMAVVAPRVADLSKLVKATRRLATLETKTVLDGLCEDATPQAGDGLRSQLIEGAAQLRAAGHRGPLLALASDRLADNMARELPALQGIIGEVRYVAADEIACNVLLMEAGDPTTALVVGLNYALGWQRAQGAEHVFSLTVSLALHVQDKTGFVKLVDG
jgi:hypothetical protein